MKNFFFVFLFTLVFCFNTEFAPDTSFEECYGQINNQTMENAYLEKIAEVEHGQKYYYWNGSESHRLIFVNLTGNAYDHGFAMGTLLREEINFVVKNFSQYIAEFILKFLGKIPEWLNKALSKFLVWLMKELCNITFIIRKPYIKDHFIDEMRGLSIGSKIDYMDIVRANMIPEMLKAFCCLVSAWGPATKDSHTYLLRALDWDQNTPATRYPLISVYHPEKGFPFANYGFAGLIGALTASSSQRLAMGEQLWGPVNGSQMSLGGAPWHFNLRDIAQFSENLGDAVKRLMEAARTCLIHLMVSSDKDKSGRGVFYSHNIIEFYDDTNYTRHATFPGTVAFPYRGNRCVASILNNFKDHNIDQDVLLRYIPGLHQTGDTFVGVFDLTTEDAYLSFAEYGTGIPAYARPAFKINMRQFYDGTNVQPIINKQ